MTHLPIDSDFTYKTFKAFARSCFDNTKSELPSLNPIKVVYTTYFYDLDVSIDENGLEKLVCLIDGMQYLIEHGEIDIDLAYVTYWNIVAFEIGGYDDLLTEDELRELNEDIAMLNRFYSTHPEYTERKQ